MSRLVDRRLVRQVPAMRRLLPVLGAIQLAAALAIVVQAGLLADLIVRIFDHSAGAHAVLDEVGLLVGVGAARAGLAALQEWVVGRASLTVRSELRARTLAAVVALGPLWVRRQPAGRVLTATGPGLDALDGYVTRALPAAVAAMVVPPVVLVRIGLADWSSAVILAVLLPLVPLFLALVGITTHRHVQRQYAALGQLAGRFVDLLRGLTTLRIYGRAEAQEEALRRVTDSYRQRTLATLRVAFLSGLVLDLLAALSVAVVAVDVGLRLDGGHVSLATALLVLLLAPELFAPLRAVGAHHHATEEGTTAAVAALDIVDEAVEGRPASTGSPHVTTGGSEFDGVTVTYPGRSEPALRDVDVRFETGRIHALTGVSGAGKSTVLAALLGFVRRQAGRVTVDFADGPRTTLDVDLDAHRRQVAWLPQRPAASQPTVTDEVRLGDPSATAVDVADVCRRCRTPELGTPLGEDGRAVSAGQLRRIALARVLLRARAVRAAGGTPIVLLDEPSEDLDAETESVVADIVAEMRGWATVVLATHSEVLAGIADVRVEMAGGRVVARREQVPQRPRPIVPNETEGRVGAAPAGQAPRRAVRRTQLRELAATSGARRRLALAAALAGFGALSALGLTTTSMWLISRAAQHPNVQALAVAVVGVRTFAIGRAVLRYAERLATHDGALRMLTTLRVRVFSTLRTRDPSALGEHRRGDLLRRFVGDVDAAQEGVARAVVPAVGAVAGAVGATVIALLLDPLAGCVLGLGLAIAATVVPVLAGRSAGTGLAAGELVGERDRHVTALLDALDVLVAYGQAGAATAAVDQAERRIARASRPAVRAATAASGGNGLAAAFTLGGIVLAAAHAVAGGQLAVVGVAVLVACTLSGFDAVSALGPARVAWVRCRAGLARVAEIVGDEPAPAGPASAAPLGPRSGVGLSVRDVTVAPAPDAPAVLAHADLAVRPGERVAIAGPSGCGKSTLLAATLGLRPPLDGQITVTTDHVDVSVAALDATRRPAAVAGSLQGDHVFDVTLRDNLRVVRPSAPDALLDEIAARAGLRETVAALPDGWDTVAGPDGSALSGGQRQRLLLARALLADPAVLVLDEPTAHLDAVTEERVLADLLDATSGRTVLMSTHRRLAAGRVDRVARVCAGSVVAEPDRREELIPC